MCNRDNKQAKPGAAGQQRAHEASPAFRALVEDPDELFTSLKSMLTVLSGSLDRDPERLMREDMEAMGWQVHIISTFVDDLKEKFRIFEPSCNL